MSDPIFSPDGQLIWTGSEWIPAPPTSPQSANVNIKDNVIGGDVNINQNKAEDIATAIVLALERMGFSAQSSPAELTPSQQAEVEQVLEMSEQLADHGIEIDPMTEITLGNAAHMAGRKHSAQRHYLRADDPRVARLLDGELDEDEVASDPMLASLAERIFGLIAERTDNAKKT